MSRKKTLLRLAKRLGLGLAGLVLLLLLALLWLTQTASGRSTLVGLVLPAVNGALPGELEVRELRRLDFGGVELRGVRVLDPKSKEVLRLEELDVAIAIRELIRGRIVVPSVRLASLNVDLRELGDPRHGLVAAFVDPDAPKSPPSKTPPPYVEVSRIEVRELAVRLPRAGPLGELDARHVALDASFTLDGTPSAVLERFGAELERQGKPLARVKTLQAKLERGAKPSRVELAATLLETTKVELSASAVVPPEPTFRTRPVAAELTLTGVSGRTLATLLRDEALESAFSGELAASLRVSGTLERLALALSLETAGGAVSASASVDDFERANVALACNDLHLERVRAGLPARRVTLDLGARADWKDPKRIPVNVELRNSRLDDTTLPHVTLAANVMPDRADGIELAVKDERSALRARGEARFDGAVDVQVTADVEPRAIEKWSRFAGVKTDATGTAHLEAKVQTDEKRTLKLSADVAVRELSTGDVRAERADVHVRLSGQPERPVGDVKVIVERASLGKQSIPRLELHAEGGPTKYRTSLDGDFGDATAKLDLALERGTDRVTVEAEGEGVARGEPWKLVVEPTTVTSAGEISTRGVALELSGQGVQAQGKFSKRESALELSTGRIELAKFSRLLGLTEPLHGSAELKAHLAGTPAVPKLAITLRGEDLALGERPPLALALDAALDAERGEATIKLALHAQSGSAGKRPLELELDASHRFRAGPGFDRALTDGTLDARLEIARLESEFVAAWAKLDALPASGTLRCNLRASGTRNAPKLELDAAADGKLLGVALKPAARFAYDEGSSRLELSVDDDAGRWLDLAAELALAGDAPSLANLLARLPRAGSDETWSLTLAASEREFSRLPGLTRAGIPAAVKANLELRHEPRAEPSATFAVSLRPTPKLDENVDPRCKTKQAVVELTGTLGSGRLRADVRASDRGKHLLDSRIETELAVAPALAGGSPELGRIHAELETRALDLATLPLACGIAQGTLDARVKVHDPLGARPEISAAVAAKRLSLGTPETVDVALDASATHEFAKASLVLTAKEGRSTLDARLPLTVEKGRVRIDDRAPLRVDVELGRLPLAPFLPPDGAISYATGSIGGSVRARGSLRSPDLRGELTLEDVGFTATDLAQPVRDVRGKFSFTQNSLKIENLEAHDRDGVVKIDGDVRLDHAKGVTVALDVTAHEFPIRQQGQVVATTEIEAKVKAKLVPQRTEVVIDLGAVDMWIESLDIRTGIALDSNPDFVIDGRAPTKEPPAAKAEAPDDARAVAKKDDAKRGAPPKGPKSAAAAKTLDGEPVTLLELNAKERIWIKRDDFAVKIGAQLRTEIAGPTARVTGRVSLLRGYLTLMGKDFEIQKGSALTFIGSPKPNPVLDITAVHLNRRSGDSVSVVITGRADKPILTFKVDDKQVSAGEAFQAIYGSQQSNADPKNADAQAKAFVGGLTAGLLATTARRELGAAAPIIMIEPGADAGSGRLRAGFEFDSLVPSFLKDVITGVYFEGIVSKESSESSSQGDARTEAGVLLEFYFPRNFFTSGQYGPGPTWSMDVGWQL